MVFYYRSRMVECLAPAEELERAKQMRGNLEVDGEDDSGEESGS
jgi:hypothetical protein